MAGFENDVMVAKNLNFDETAAKPHLGIINAAGKLPIGTGNSFPTPEILAGSLTSPDSSITFGYSSPNITATVTGGSTSVLRLTGNSGVATPVAGNINVITANSTITFVGSGSTLTQDFSKTNIIFGTSLPALAGGSQNVGVGANVLNSLTTASSNCIFGTASGTAITTSGNNIAIGAFSLTNLTTAAGGLGQNIAIGGASLAVLVTGVNNIGLGASVGSAYTTSESNNILLSSAGVVGESNVIRIGTQGTGAKQQNQCYLAGVINTVSGRVVKITSPGAYPYTTLITDYVILVDTSAARTIVPLAAPVTGTTYRIKDSVGSAAANNITITPSGKNIDGVASYVINNAYGAVDIVYNGTEWNKF